MTDTELLRGKIKENGLKLGYVAEQLGLTRQGFGLKLNNTNEFTTSEVLKLCELLGITSLREKEKIFFA